MIFILFHLEASVNRQYLVVYLVKLTVYMTRKFLMLRQGSTLSDLVLNVHCRASAAAVLLRCSLRPTDSCGRAREGGGTHSSHSSPSKMGRLVLLSQPISIRKY